MQVQRLVEAPSSQGAPAAEKTRAAVHATKTDAATSAQVDDEQLKSIVREANTTLAAKRAELQFVLEGEPRQLVVKLIDRESKQVLRQFPSEEMIAIARNLDRLKGVAVHSVA